ncbi:PAAR domain-containing protein [Paraburkholderia graminis]
MKRFLILNGDRTTTSGVVQTVSTTIQLSDKDVAHEGDPVACPACNTAGKCWF